MFELRAGLMRKHWGISHPGLFQHCRVGTKLVVEEFVNTLAGCIRGVAEARAEVRWAGVHRCG